MKKLFYHVLFFEVLLVPFAFSFLANDTFQGPKALVFYAAAICLAAAAGYAVLKGRAIKVNVPALLAWLAFTLVAAATLFFAKDKVTGLFGHRHTESVVFYVAGFFTLLGAMQLEGAQWATILDVVVYQGPIFSLLVLVQSFLQVLTFDYSSSVLTRGDGATGNPMCTRRTFWCSWLRQQWLHCSRQPRCGDGWCSVFFYSLSCGRSP
jgi:hypothetical protein